jgi:hypothetical protein
VELLPPWLPLPLTAALPFAKARPRAKPAPPPLSLLGPPLLVPQQPRHALPRVIYGPILPNSPSHNYVQRMVVRSRSPPREPLVPWMRPRRTPSKSPLASQRHP